MPTINDTALEKTFSDLAYAHLRDKAQGLLDYLVAFQMLKQEGDGQRAVGIFGFQIDKDFYYAPVFFLNGEIRGLDSLYSVKSDMFVPLTDGWINELINRQQQQLGEADMRSKTERGIRVPNYTKLKVIPGGAGGASINLKLGSAGVDAMFDVPTYAVPSLVDHLGQLGWATQFKEAMAANPKLARAFEAFYSELDLVDAPVSIKRAEDEKSKPVTIVGSITDEGIDRLTDEQRKTILEGGQVVIDDRPEVSKAQLYRSETKIQLQNPDKGGLYDVLWADGTVDLAIITWTNTTTNKVLVYRVSDGHHAELNVRMVYVLTRYSDQEYMDWLDKNAVKADEVKPNQAGVFLSTEGQSTGGLCIKNVRRGLDDLLAADVRDCYYMEARRSLDSSKWTRRGNNGNADPNMYHDLRIGGNGNHEFSNFGNRPSEDPNCRVTEALIGETGGSVPRYTKSRVIVNNRRFWWLKLNSFSESVKDPNAIFATETYELDKPKVILGLDDFGDYETVQTAFSKVAQELVVWKSSDDVLNVKLAEQVYSGSPRQTLSHLVLNVGLGEDDAREVIKVATVYEYKFMLRPTVKSAGEMLQLPDETENDMGGGFMSQFHPQQVPYRMQNVAQPANNREFYQYYSPFGQGGSEDQGGDTTGIVEKAEKSGQKEVFDAAALASLIKSHNPTDMVDRFLPTITAGMDRIGRMLFLIFWHFDKFEDRYGEQDLTQFIDDLRSVFEQLGDIVVFAKKRQLSGDPDHFGMAPRPILDDTPATST